MPKKAEKHLDYSLFELQKCSVLTSLTVLISKAMITKGGGACYSFASSQLIGKSNNIVQFTSMWCERGESVRN